MSFEDWLTVTRSSLPSRSKSPPARHRGVFPNSKVNAASKLTKLEKRNIVRNRGRTKALREALSGIFEIESRMLEVGSSLTTNDGVVTDFVHFVSPTSLERMEQEMEVELTPRAYIERMLAAVESEATLALRSHFGLSEEFKVALYGGLRAKSANVQLADVDDGRTAKQAMSAALNRYFFDDPDTTKSNEQRRAEVMRMMQRFAAEKQSRPSTTRKGTEEQRRPVGAADEIELGNIMSAMSEDSGDSSSDDAAAAAKPRVEPMANKDADKRGQHRNSIAL